MTDEDSHFIQHEPCPECGSKDNLARYSNGSAYCFGCEYHEHADSEYKESKPKKKSSMDLLEGEVRDLSKRRLREDTCSKYKYLVGKYKKQTVQIAQYADERGRIVAQKIRFKNKDFKFIGEPRKATLFGQNVWDGKDSKMVVVTEGEIDAMSVSQLQRNRYPVVSVRNGAQGAAKCVKNNLKFLERYDKVVFLFDNDEHGQKAAEECASLITPSKARIARLVNYKDANEALVAGDGSEVIDAIWSARKMQPDTVYSVSDVLNDKTAELEKGRSVPFETLNRITNGMRDHEMWLWGAGTGCGKTDMVKRIAAHDIEHNDSNVGMILLEEPNLLLTIDTLAGIIDKQFYHFEDMEFDKEQRDKTRKMLDGKLYMYRCNGAVPVQEIIDNIRYFVVALECRTVVLDHVTYLLDDAEDEGEGELKLTKRLMRKLNDINKELPFTLHYIAHLRKSKDSHEEGGRIRLDDFAGGKAITQYANFVFGLERDQQGDDKNSTVLRGLKDRAGGRIVGEKIHLRYDAKTGEKIEVPEGFDTGLTEDETMDF